MGMIPTVTRWYDEDIDCEYILSGVVSAYILTINGTSYPISDEAAFSFIENNEFEGNFHV